VSAERSTQTEEQRAIRALISGALLGWVLALLSRRRHA
jgi:hypothetical protein